MQQLKTRKFTEPSVLFALTGHVFLRENAPLEYRKKCLEEIHDDDLYRFVMEQIPTNLLRNGNEEEELQDVDPIMVQYLCSSNPILKGIKDYSDKTAYPNSRKVIERKFLTNGYLEVAPIDFKSFCEIMDNISQKEKTEKEFLITRKFTQ